LGNTFVIIPHIYVKPIFFISFINIHLCKFETIEIAVLFINNQLTNSLIFVNWFRLQFCCPPRQCCHL